MITSEHEARLKWCPFAVAINDARTASGNRIAHDIDGSLPMHGCYCIASDCAAWVWTGGELSPNQLHDTRVGKCGLLRASI